ncbi:MAG: bL28 family ribosomal protein [Candidatus Uhrbacteria bacterium]
MAQRCEFCSRGAKTGHRRSHSNIKTNRLFRINLQNKKIDGARRRICTRCIRTRTKRAAEAK